jgi:hypothetical protein
MFSGSAKITLELKTAFFETPLHGAIRSVPVNLKILAVAVPQSQLTAKNKAYMATPAQRSGRQIAQNEPPR